MTLTINITIGKAVKPLTGKSNFQTLYLGRGIENNCAVVNAKEGAALPADFQQQNFTRFNTLIP